MKQTSTRDFSSISALLSHFDSLCFFDDVHSPAEDRLLFMNNLFYPSFFCFLFFSVSNFVGSRLFVVFFFLFLSKASAPDLALASSPFLLHSSAVMFSTSLRVSNLPSKANCGVYAVFIAVYDVRHHPVLPACSAR